MTKQIEEIQWTHDGERMTAIVGQQLRGKKHRYTRGKIDYDRPEISTQYDEVVVEIREPGGEWPTHTVWCTNCRHWNLPIMTGVPTSVRWTDV